MGTWASRERRGFTNQGLTLSVRPKSEMALGFRKGQILLKGRRGVPIAGLDEIGGSLSAAASGRGVGENGGLQVLQAVYEKLSHMGRFSLGSGAASLSSSFHVLRYYRKTRGIAGGKGVSRHLHMPERL